MYNEELVRHVTRVIRLGEFESLHVSTGIKRVVEWETQEQRTAKVLAADSAALDDLDRLARHAMARVRAEAVHPRETPPEPAKEPEPPPAPPEPAKPEPPRVEPPPNPYGYRLDDKGRPLCRRCMEPTNPVYLQVPNLYCWRCGHPIESARVPLPFPYEPGGRPNDVLIGEDSDTYPVERIVL